MKINIHNLPINEYIKLKEQFVKYVDDVWINSKRENLATFKDVAEKFNVYIKDIEVLAGDAELGINVAFATNAGYANLPQKEWTIEPSAKAVRSMYKDYYFNKLCDSSSSQLYCR